MRRTELLQRAITLQQGGALNEARKACEQLLRAEPRNVDAMHLLGLVFIDLGAVDKGLQLLRRAAVHAPRNRAVLNSVASELCRAGRFADGLAWFDRLIALGDLPPEILANRARALWDAGRLDEALTEYDKIILRDPGNARAQSDRGAVLAGLGRHQDALAAFDAALGLAPNDALVHGNRGNALRALDRPEDALAAYDAAIAAGSETASVLVSRGEVLLGLGHKDAARTSFEAALSRDADDADAWFNLGVVLRLQRQRTDALTCFDRALAVRPDFADALNEQGIALLDLNRHDEAIHSFTRLLAARPEYDYAIGRLQHARMFCCDWTAFDTTTRDIADRVAAGAAADVPLSLLAHQASAAHQRRCAEILVARAHPARAQRPALHARAERLRLAYLSADFRPHPMAFLMTGVFEQHDRTRFETFGISLAPPHDSDAGRRIGAAFEHVIDVSGKTDQEVAALMREMRIDIAIDLMGHTAGSRTDILALRAAPLQVNYLGYPGTMGADYIDVIIADDFVIPPELEGHYSERVVRLPGCFQASDDRRVADATPTRAELGLPDSAVVFCAFCNTMKITPPVFDVWMRLLASVPDSVLWVYADGAAARANLAREAASRGVAAARLIFAPRVSYSAHLGRLAQADLFLDTFPFNGGATVNDVLWAGVPVVTCAGAAFASRMAGSLLRTVGLADLIADDLSAYEAIAQRLATDAAARAAVTARLAQGRARLFDTGAFCRALEAALAKEVVLF